MRNKSNQPIHGSILLGELVLLLSLCIPATAQEHLNGRMWTFENPPVDYLDKKYGCKPNQEWLDSLRLSSLRLCGEKDLSGFWSASFVSPNGLILTSSRCLRDGIADSFDINMRRKVLDDGFIASEQSEEVRLRWGHGEWMAVAQLLKITNVTQQINQNVQQTDSATQVKNKRDANKQKVLKAARNSDPNLVPKIVELHHGASVQLYQYKVYNDVRLVCIPHLQIANFGGNLDLFTYPRFSLDFAFLRAYENGKPVDTSKNYLKWKRNAPKQNDVVFVSGNPGETNRLATEAQLDFMRDFDLPMQVEWSTNRLRILGDSPWIWFVMDHENCQKAARLSLRYLKDKRGNSQTKVIESAFKKELETNRPKLAERYIEIRAKIEKLVKERRQNVAKERFYSPNNMVFELVVAIVQAYDPDETNEQRERASKLVEKWAGATTINAAYPGTGFAFDHFVRAKNGYPKMTLSSLSFWMEKARRNFGIS